jgi:putative transposase
MQFDRPRRRHYDEPRHAHGLTFSCYRRYPFLKAERTCLWLSEAIGAARRRLGFALWAYVFMPDHLHLIVAPCGLDAEVEIPRILRAVKEPVGRQAARFLLRTAPEWLDRIAERRGRRVEYHFWQSGGGYDRNIIAPRTLLAMIDYIHLNPVRRGLAERPGDWPWSSAPWFEGGRGAGLEPDPIPPDWMEV